MSAAETRIAARDTLGVEVYIPAFNVANEGERRRL